jgi:hypothetical protein
MGHVGFGLINNALDVNCIGESDINFKVILRPYLCKLPFLRSNQH